MPTGALQGARSSYLAVTLNAISAVSLLRALLWKYESVAGFSLSALSPATGFPLGWRHCFPRLLFRVISISIFKKAVLANRKYHELFLGALQGALRKRYIVSAALSGVFYYYFQI